jgi:aminopeptidase N
LTTRDGDSRRGLTWPQELQLALGYEDGVRLLATRLEGGHTDIIDARDRPAPLFILPNGGGVGYGEFILDPHSVTWLSRHLPEIGDAVTRGSAWVTLWDSLINGALPSMHFLTLAVAALPRETDELNVQQLLSYVEHAFWVFTADDDRRSCAAGVERALRTGLASSAAPSLKGAYLAALQAIASTAETVDWLLRVWQGDELVSGLALAEGDFITLALALAVRDEDASHNILDRQINRTMNPDRKASLQFIAPALSPQPAVRDRFFASLADVANRRHERWVLDGMRQLHHPLRAASAIRYIDPALGLLPHIQQTGDLFFPTQWLKATLGRHRSAEAAAVVRRFLDGAPATFPDDLRRLIVTAADSLFRISSRSAAH